MSNRRLRRWIEAAQDQMTVLVEQASQESYPPGTTSDMLFQSISHHLEQLSAIDEEIEEQNRLLRETRASIKLEHQRYRDLFEFAPYAYIVTDRSGVIREANQAATELLRAPVDALLGKPLRRFVAPPDRQRFLGHLEELRAAQMICKWELQITPWEEQRSIDAAIRAAPSRDRTGKLTMICWMIRDITHRKSMDAALQKANEDLGLRVREATAGMQMAVNALRESQEHLLLAKQAGEIGIWDWDPGTGDLTMDDQCSRLFGLKSSCTLSRAEFLKLIYPDDRKRLSTVIDENSLNLIDTEVEFRVPCPETGVHWIYARGIGIQDPSGKMSRATGIALDITRQKRAAEEEKRSTVQAELQHLLIDQREKERLQIARDLHDGPLQELIGTVFALQGLVVEAGDQPLVEPLKAIKESLQSQAEELRVFAGQLRSATLFKFGLEKAIRDHLEALQQKYPEVAVRVEADPERPPLPQTVRMALYRICQEALNNAIRHGKAARIDVTLSYSPETVEMQIRDDGSGFELPVEWIELARGGHLGLVGIRERAEAVGGRLEIRSRPGKGSTLLITAPVHQDA